MIKKSKSCSDYSCPAVVVGWIFQWCWTVWGEKQEAQLRMWPIKVMQYIYLHTTTGFLVEWSLVNQLLRSFIKYYRLSCARHRQRGKTFSSWRKKRKFSVWSVVVRTHGRTPPPIAVCLKIKNKWGNQKTRFVVLVAWYDFRRNWTKSICCHLDETDETDDTTDDTNSISIIISWNLPHHYLLATII